ncbi:putative NAD(P)H nitroreductase [Catellatospora sp. IY07-71]|uniref:Acg family FMN-binding oxidoreductase n=1 Tax=Catellatospora sp. IY07-71 TaxID=2728827 RepID=UPI001BB4B2B3|nr:nitroreductase family protein [Catellatospora sp. IY07-71]BCJ74657.1 putative NAD(P)H nitroreductase [Catellatospora sp. IY07-71]
MRADESLPDEVLRDAARTALAAPSIFNTQPWRWVTGGGRLRLYADRQRQLLVADPQARLLTVSCGVALHHARVALAMAGYAVDVRRLPAPEDPDLLAELTLTGPHETTAAERGAFAAIPRRRTDRRAFTERPVAAEVCAELVAAARAQGADLQLVGDGELAVLALNVVRAGALRMADPEYRAELADWTHRPPWSGDGVDTAGAVRAVPRRVPVRDFAPFGGPTLAAGPDSDRGARYAVVFTEHDGPADWLRGGEALSAVLLTAVRAGLGTAPISDVTELSVTRDELRRLLPDGGYPQLAVRVGYAPPGEPPRTVRRLFEEVLEA